MIVEVLAIVAAFFYGLSGVLVSKGLTTDPESSPFAAAFVTMLIQFFVMWCLSIFSFSSIHLEAILIFALSGVLAQCVGRTVNYIGISRLGVSRNNPIVGANPLFSVVIAAIFLGEVVTLPVFTGAVLIILGIGLISLQNQEANEMKRGGTWQILFPLIAAVCYGFSTNLRKIGLNILPSSILGSTFAASGGLSVYLPLLFLFKKIKNFSLRRCNIYFLGAGLSISLAWIFSFTALVIGEVSIVSPIQGTSPLFALILSKIFLKKTEKITYKIAMGALAVVSGVILISS